MYDASKQLLPLITPDMLRTMPDQTCDILNRLIRFYQDYQKESTKEIETNTTNISNNADAIAQNTSDIASHTSAIADMRTDIATIEGDLGGLATVAKTGSYTDLSDTPNLATVATTGSYNDLLNRPTIPTMSGILNAVYPVGAIYMSYNSTSPATLFGGTWTQIQGRFLLSSSSSYSAGSTGGEATHTLTINEMPSHHHSVAIGSQGSVAQTVQHDGGGYRWHAGSKDTTDTGGDKAHNNMPPYLVVYMWRRTG